ncbi:hypothetical protein BsWGS_04994 [Bradybaena similaris]
MESSNNNLNPLHPGIENDNKTIDRLEMVDNHHSDCVNPDYPAQEPRLEQDDGNDNYYISDINQSYSETMLARDKRNSSIRKDKSSVYENTFRMEPKSDQYFIGYKVKALMMSVAGPLFSNFVYESRPAANLCRLICNKVILMMKKKFDWPRYRYVCHATIAESNQQGLIIAERCLWNTAIDGNAVCTFESKSAVLVVTLHGIYFE